MEQCGAERRERLSTGRYTLIDISCRGCCSKLGWHYLAAASPVSILPGWDPLMLRHAAAHLDVFALMLGFKIERGRPFYGLRTKDHHDTDF